MSRTPLTKQVAELENDGGEPPDTILNSGHNAGFAAHQKGFVLSADFT